jgi:signal peptidase I
VQGPKLANRSRGRGILFEVAQVAALAVGLYLVITLAIQTVHVQGISMLPTVEHQDYLVASKIDYRLHAPQRGDIIIMRDPADASRDFIKRVIAVPGEWILVRRAAVYIDGRRLDEPYLNTDEAWTVNVGWPRESTGSVEGQQLGPDEYFVMGDNRNESNDSRSFGPIHRDAIEARAWIRVIPVNRIGPIDSLKPRLTNVPVPPAT